MLTTRSRRQTKLPKEQSDPRTHTGGYNWTVRPRSVLTPTELHAKLRDHPMPGSPNAIIGLLARTNGPGSQTYTKMCPRRRGPAHQASLVKRHSVKEMK